MFWSVVGLVAVVLLGVLYVRTVKPNAYALTMVVKFKPDTTLAQREAVRTACPGAPNITLLPPDDNKLASSREYPVRYDTTQANAVDKADLMRCLNEQPGVYAVSEQRADAG